jgi:NADPH-dependent 2,4-dienoyl-CoA reductase/sulfur reductase-like enzyme
MTNTLHGRRAAIDGIVIAGGGLAAQRCAETLRREGYAGPIRIVCAERHRPYDRPPLSKQLLAGAHDGDTLAFRPDAWYAEHSIGLMLGVKAVALRPGERRVDLSNGRSLRYETLLIATGGRPRRLPALDGYRNVSTLRGLDEALSLRERLGTGAPLTLVGAGFVGLEVAATARARGLEVTVVEAAEAPLAGVLGPELGRWFTRLHEQEGVRMLTGRTLEHVQANGVVRSLRLSDGTVLPGGEIVVGIGVAPDTDWLAGCGLETAAGIPVDPYGRTGIPDVFAAGDAAATLEPTTGRHLPGSHWEAAARQGQRVARLMLGLDPGRAPVTSFWTDQYGLRIQYLGHSRGAEAVTIDGDLEARSFTATFTRAGRAVAALLVNRPRDLPAARALIEKGIPA